MFKSKEDEIWTDGTTQTWNYELWWEFLCYSRRWVLSIGEIESSYVYTLNGREYVTNGISWLCVVCVSLFVWVCGSLIFPSSVLILIVKPVRRQRDLFMLFLASFEVWGAKRSPTRVSSVSLIVSSVFPLVSWTWAWTAKTKTKVQRANHKLSTPKKRYYSHVSSVFSLALVSCSLVS